MLNVLQAKPGGLLLSACALLNEIAVSHLNCTYNVPSL